MSTPTLPKTLRPLVTISPSGAGKAIINDGCRFRLLVQAWINQFNPVHNPEGIHKMLPDTGANIFGTIVHSVLEWAYRNGHNGIFGSRAGAFDLWDRLIEKKNDELLAEPLNAHLVPLEHIGGYLRRRGRICHFAEKRIGAHIPSAFVVPPDEGGNEELRTVGSEVLVQDSISAPRVKGKIDLIIDDGVNIELFDWKTGNILDDNGEIKIEYRVQLQLYAALFECKQIDLGISPTRFPIKATLKNPETGVAKTLELPDLDPLVCRDMLYDAIELHRHINASVTKDDDTRNLMMHLAKPDLDGCRFCTVRPACLKYLSGLDVWMRDVVEDAQEIGLQDVRGEFVSVHRSGPRSPAGTIIIRDLSNREWRIAGIDLDANRNETTMKTIQSGDTVSVFNIQKNLETNLLGYIHAKVNPRTHIVYATD